DHLVRLHARQGPPPHHLRLRDDPRALDPQQSCSSLLATSTSTTAYETSDC
uniref:Uncharacterized protein n=1 Tax=Aegilops tauschii subsp. strangulata TaxID=200361 RepID=A0A453RLA6_AEGTS